MIQARPCDYIIHVTIENVNKPYYDANQLTIEFFLFFMSTTNANVMSLKLSPQTNCYSAVYF